MPKIIESGSGNGVASRLLESGYQKEQEAKDRKLAERDFEFRQQQADRDNELRQNRDARAQADFERRGGIAERVFSQGEADRDSFIRDGNDSGFDTTGFESMSLERISDSLKLQEYQRRIEESKENSGRQLENIFGDLNAPQGEGDVQGPPEEPSEQEQGIRAMFEAAQTPEDYAKVTELARQYRSNTKKQERDQAIRIANVERHAESVARSVEELPDDLGDLLESSQFDYLTGEISYSKFLSGLQEAAEWSEKKNGGGGIGPIFNDQADLIKSAVKNRDISFEEGNRRLQELAASKGFGQVEPSEKTSQETAEIASPTTRLSMRRIGKLIGKDDAKSLIEDSAKVAPEKREDFVLNRITRISAEKGLSQEQILDIVESILDQSP